MCPLKAKRMEASSVITAAEITVITAAAWFSFCGILSAGSDVHQGPVNICASVESDWFLDGSGINSLRVYE